MASPAIVCLNSTTTLTATGGGGTGSMIYWYKGTDLCGGTYVGQGSPLTVTPTLGVTIYWARYVNPGCSSGCVSTTVTVNSVPVAPTFPGANPSTICSGNTTTLHATPQGGGTLTWYSGSCGGTWVGTGNNLIVTPVIPGGGIQSGTLTYYARMENPPCTSSTCVSVTVTIHPSNVAPSVSATPNPLPQGASTTLHATNGSGTTLNWYTGSCGNTWIGTGNDLVVSPTVTTTYYAQWESTTCPAACASVTVVVQTLTLSGVVQYDNPYLTPLNGVLIYLYKDGVYTNQYTTTAPYFTGSGVTQGYYQFPGLVPGNYSLHVSYNGTWGGVNATDALVIELFWINPVTYPLSGLFWKAGDVDTSHVVDATDALWVKYRVVNMIDYFPAGDWVFNNGPIIVAGNTSYNFQGLCTGDVNASYIPTGFKSQSFISVIDDGTRYISTGQSFNYEIKPSINTEIGAMTLFLGYNQGLVDIENVKSSIGEIQYNLFDNGKIGLAWSTINPVTTNESKPIITLQMKAKEFIPEPTRIFTIEGGSEFANANADRIFGLDLKMSKLATATNSFSISNYPNPFQNSTTIVYNLPEQGHVTLTVTNIYGQSLRTLVNTDQMEGIYKVTVDPADLNLQPGVYMYKIEVNGVTTNYNQVNKMIFTR
jgi:hypothetical protein